MQAPALPDTCCGWCMCSLSCRRILQMDLSGASHLVAGSSRLPELTRRLQVGTLHHHVLHHQRIPHHGYRRHHPKLFADQRAKEVGDQAAPGEVVHGDGEGYLQPHQRSTQTG